MAFFDHFPETLVDIIVNAREYFGRDNVPVIVCPPSQDRVDLFDKGDYRFIRRFTDQRPDFSDEGEGTLFGGGDMQLVAVLAKSLAEEVESVFDVDDFGFLL